MQSVVLARLPGLVEWVGKRIGPAEAAPSMPPLARVPGPRSSWRVGLVTAAGVHRTDQPPFDMTDPNGDPTFRLLPTDPEVADLTITHDYYDHGAADRDINCVFPLDRLRELAAEGAIGGVAPRHVGFMGHVRGPHLTTLARETAPAIAQVFVEDDVDVVVAAPG